MRPCNKCGEEKPLSEFRVQKNSSCIGGLYVNKQCKQCQRDTAKARSENPHVKIRRKFDHIALRYGLTESEWSSMLKSQDGKCAICLKLLTKPFTDHNHQTGKVRGILCGPCNMYIGHIKESVSILLRARTYLQSQ